MRTWNSIRLDEFMAADRLPTPPGVALAIMRLTATEGANVQEIARVVETDPALVGRVIKLANSALMAGRRPAASAREAVVRVGMHAVSNLALGFWLVSQSRSVACQSFDYGCYWQQSLAIAAAAKAIAQRGQDIAPDEAFTCGLLSQVGRLALATVYPEQYAEILARCQRDGEELLAHLERDRFATDHTEVTVALLEHWGLPGEYAEAVFSQSLGTDNRSESPRGRALTQVLDLAMRLARACLMAEHQRERVLAECLSRGEKQGIEPKVLLGLADRAVAELRQWSEVLKVPAPELAPFAQRGDAAPAPLVVENRAAVKIAAPAPAAVPAGPESPRSTRQDSWSDTFTPLARLRILVVSRDAELLSSLTRSLAAAGHAITPAQSREEALRAMLETVPQVLIADDIHAAGEGTALCRQLRQSRLGRYLYVLALTDSFDEPFLSRLHEVGVDDFLVKPVDSCNLSARLRVGRRLLGLQEEAQRDKEEMGRFAVELAVANRRLHHAAYEDALTHLPNRRYAMERLAQEWARTNRTAAGLACILADIDHFKRVNDTYGHDAGDLVLQSIADVLRKGVRSSDLACRLGGEEFLILGPDTDLSGARTCAERLCGQVAAHRIRLAKAELTLTISLGVAVRAGGMKNAEDLLKKADEAVYLAKRSGRNQVRS